MNPFIPTIAIFVIAWMLAYFQDINEEENEKSSK